MQCNATNKTVLEREIQTQFIVVRQNLAYVHSLGYKSPPPRFYYLFILTGQVKPTTIPSDVKGNLTLTFLRVKSNPIQSFLTLGEDLPNTISEI